jgi:beta-lactamase regulating signal transducer with metallopeptidase domain
VPNIFSPAVADRIAWALLDSLWEAALITATLSAAHAALGPTTARFRHATALAGLAGIVIAFGASAFGSHAAVVPPFPLSQWIVAAWLLWTIALLIHLIGGWWLLKHRHDASPAIGWDEHATRLRERFAITRPVRIVQGGSRDIGVFGRRRPVIVVPADASAALDSKEVAAVLAHEFAHVRRHDYAVNLLQTGVEALFFYNPGVWLMARWARITREQCCDELSAAVCGGAIEYAEVLLALEWRRKQRAQDPSSGSGGQLLARVRWLTSDAPSTVRHSASVAMAGVGGILIGALWALHQARVALVLRSAVSLSFAHTTDGFVSLPQETALALWVACGLGLLLGVRHACEPDHLVALSTLVTEEGTPSRAARLGVSWGIGHAATLLVVATVLAAVHRNLSARLSDGFDIGVAIMLTILGIRALMLAVQHGAHGPARAHSHGTLTHRHAGMTGHVHVGSWTLAPRPLLVGAMHGLAGSGALTALVMADLPSMMSRFAYIVVFAAGSTIGMAALSATAGWPVSRLVRRPVAMTTLYAVSGVLAITYGVMTGSPLVHQWFR